MFTFIAEGDANRWTILCGDNWFMTLRMNGELMEHTQRYQLQLICDKLNAHYRSVVVSQHIKPEPKKGTIHTEDLLRWITRRFVRRDGKKVIVP